MYLNFIYFALPPILTFTVNIFGTLSVKYGLYTLYIDLARAKSEALINIYSLLKQNINSCNAKWQYNANKNSKKRKSDLIGKKLCSCSTLMHIFFLAVVLCDYNL